LGAATASGLGARLGSCCLALRLDVRATRAALCGLGGVYMRLERQRCRGQLVRSH
jgi:hypothetical protein